MLQPLTDAQNDYWLSRRQETLAKTPKWHLRGRIAIRARGEGTSANVDWHQDSQKYHVRMSGPFGRGAVVLDGDGSQAILRDGEGELKAPTASGLVEKRTGWKLPIENLRFWMRALPVPGAPAHVEFNMRGEVLEIVQNGFKLSYSEYISVGGVKLPQRWELKHPSIRLRAFVSSWEFEK